MFLRILELLLLFPPPCGQLDTVCDTSHFSEDGYTHFRHIHLGEVELPHDISGMLLGQPICPIVQGDRLMTRGNGIDPISLIEQ